MKQPTPAALEHLADVGRMAREWLDADHERQESEDAIRRDEVRVEDLHFQLAQLKGRLGSVGAAQEVDHTRLRGEAEELESQLEEALAQMARLSAPVVEHLVSFPELRDHVRLLGSAQILP